MRNEERKHGDEMDWGGGTKASPSGRGGFSPQAKRRRGLILFSFVLSVIGGDTSRQTDDRCSPYGRARNERGAQTVGMGMPIRGRFTNRPYRLYSTLL